MKKDWTICILQTTGNAFTSSNLPVLEELTKSKMPPPLTLEAKFIKT
jgi:hypothetical protein